MSKNNKNFFAEKSEWAKVKDDLLGYYLAPYLQKILRTGRPLLYVDGFAGKGVFDDGNYGSPLLACLAIENALEKTRSGNGNVRAYFVEPQHFKALEGNISKFPFAKAVEGYYQDAIPMLQHLGRGANLFLYVDPFGVKHLRTDWFQRLQGAFDSTEVLLNFNSFGFFREACRVYGTELRDVEGLDEIEERSPWDCGSPSESSQILTKAVGGDFWRDIVNEYKKEQIDGYEAEARLAKEYRAVLSDDFTYVLNIPIRVREGNRPKYRMYHLTNHHDGCNLMYDNMQKRLADTFLMQHDGQGSLFDMDTENEILYEDEILSRFEDFVSMRANGQLLESVIAEFVAQEGVGLPLDSFFKRVGKMEQAGIIGLRRQPPFTEQGNPCTFLHSTKGKAVFIEKVR